MIKPYPSLYSKLYLQAFTLLSIITCLAAPFAKAQVTAPAINYAGNNQTYTVGTAIVSLTPTNTGGAVPATVYGQVSTFAGSDSYGNADGIGTAATFGQPTGIAIDKNGNMYVSDAHYNCIRKITPAGQVSLFAGSSSGDAGFTNGAGTNARFNSPGGIAIDANGNLYVAEAGNNRIRIITSAGLVSNFAGTGVAGAANTATGVLATFNFPTDIAIDGSGSLYVADKGNNLIRKITSSGVVSTFAGSGTAGKVNATGTAASFSDPSGLTIDAAGNLYVTDTKNGQIRKISPLGVVTTFAGAGNSFDTVDGIGTIARFYLPRFITIDSFGDLYVTETNVIRKISPSAVVTTLAGANNLFYSTDGTGVAAGFSSPWALVMDGQHNLIVVDGQKIRKITATGYTINPGLPPGLNFNPTTGEITGTAVAVSPAIEYSVTASNSAGRSSVPLTISTQLPLASNTAAFSPAIASAGSTITIKGVNLTGTSAVSFGGVPAKSFIVRSDTLMQAVVDGGRSGDIIVTKPSGLITLPGFTYTTAPNISYLTSKTYTAGVAINTLAPTNSGGAVPPLEAFPGVSLYATLGPTVSGSYAGLGGITTDVSGNLYVVDVSHNQIKRISPTGSVIVLAGSGAAGSTNGTGITASFNNIAGITSDVSGNLYVAEAGNRLIRKITPAGVVSTLAGSGATGKVNGIGTAASFNYPAGITIDGSGNVYVADRGNNLVRKITPAGEVSTLAGSGASGSANGQGVAASFNDISAITTDNSGNIYAADYGNHLIRKITPAGLVTTFAGSGTTATTDGVGTAASFRYPFGLTSDGFGNIYVADQTTDDIRRITPSGEVSTLQARLSFADLANSSYNANPHGLTIDANGNLFTTGQNEVIKILIGGYVIRLGNSTGGQVLPSGLTFDNKTGVITGTPTAEFAASTYTITAYNVAGSSTTTLSLTVNAAPNITYVNNTQNYNIGAAITPLKPTNTGGAVPATVYGQVSVFAGSGASGNTNGTGTAASFAAPGSCAADAYGNVYVADRLNNLIRKITPAGVVSTFAGNGVAAQTDGIGTAASFFRLSAIAVDGAGIVYVTDAAGGSGYSLIRKITPAGVVSTLAGTDVLNNPLGLVVDIDGNIYVAERGSDSGNNLIRKITPTGVVSIFAGNSAPGRDDGVGTAASFKGPSGVAISADGNSLYVTDFPELIRSITRSNGEVKTLAGDKGHIGDIDGTGDAARFNQPWGIAADATGNIYVTEGTGVIRKITLNPAAVVTTLATGLGSLSSATVDPSGNLYLADIVNNRILKMATTGYSITPALPAGLSFDSATGTISGKPTTISLTTDYTITAYNAAGSSSTSIRLTISAAALQAPNISYTTPQTYTAGTAIAALTPTNTGGAVPATTYGRVTTFAGSGADGSADGLGTAASFHGPGALGADAIGNLYVADTGNNGVIRKVTPAGLVSTLAGLDQIGQVSESLSYGFDVTADVSGNVYVADPASRLVRKISPAGVVTTLAGGAAVAGGLDITEGQGTAVNFTSPYGLATDAAGNVYVTDYGHPRISKITPAGMVSVLAGAGSSGNVNGAGSAARFNLPQGIAVDISGNVYVADTYNNSIRKITPGGLVSTFAGSAASGSTNGIGTAARFNFPQGVALDVSGNMYVADGANNLIRIITPAGVVSTLAGSGDRGNGNGIGTAASFFNPLDVATDAVGNVYVGDAGNRLVRKITATGYTISPALPDGLSLDSLGRITGTPTASSPATDYTIIAYNAAGSSSTTVRLAVSGAAVPMPNISYVTPQNYTVGVGIEPLKPTNTGGPVPDGFYGVAAAYAGSIIATTNEDGTENHFSLRNPQGLALDADGNLFVANYDNNVISKVTPDGVISTFAGSGAVGFANGKGTAATFRAPAGVALDAARNVYVADVNNNLIRKITPAGQVTTFAGSGAAGKANGTGTAATFNAPSGLTVDAAGNVYVTDGLNNQIRKITPAGQVTTLAGSGAAGKVNGTGAAAAFNLPAGIAVDAAGNLYVADMGNNVIRKITPAGAVTVFAGSGTAGNTNGTGTAARFDHPYGIAVGPDGNVYVADAWNRRVRKITPAGVVTTMTAEFSSNISGIAINPAGDIYVAVLEGGIQNTIRKISAGGYAVSPALPNSVYLNANGSISGMPAVVSPATDYTITAYNAGGSSSTVLNLSVGKGAQTITFPSIPDQMYGGADFALSAWASSNLPVSYTSSNTAVATVVNGVIHITGAGTTTITASQAGNDSYAAAPPKSQQLTVGKVAQTVTFATIATKTYGGADFTLTASSGSKLPVSYTSSNTAVATVDNGVVHITGAGTTTITATQAGSDTYASAAASQLLTVNKSSQTISFTTPPTKKYLDSDFYVSAVSSSGLALNYSIVDTTVAKFVNGMIHILKAGTTGIIASQAGSDNYNAASSITRNLTISKASQTITFATPATKKYSDGSFSLGATASSGLAVSYLSSDTLVAKINAAGLVTLRKPGTVTITANQAGSTNYNAATALSRTLSISKGDQAITFAALPSKTFGDASFAPGAVSSSKLVVDYSSSDTSVAVITAGRVVIKNGGQVTITAIQSGSDLYNAAPSVSQQLSIGKAAQTITFAAITAKLFGGADFALTAVSSSKLPVSFTSSNTAVATVANGVVHITGVGTATITASQDGNSKYTAAAAVSQVLTVNKASQTITFATIPTKTYIDTDFYVSAVSSANLPVSYSITDTTVARFINGKVHIIKAGTVGIIASQAGNGSYNAANPVTRNVTIGKAAQTITFATLTTKKYSDGSFTLSATSSSGLAVSYLSSDTLTAKINAAGVVTLRKPGTVTITAGQAGNANYNAAASLNRTLSIIKGDQAITFAALPAKTFGDASFAPGAVSSSKLVVDYSSSDTTVAAITAGKVVIKNSGQATITAKQTGNDLYNAAPAVSQQLSIGKAAQTITFAAITAKLFGGADFALSATSSSKLPVSFTSSNTAVATVANGVVHITGAGTATITASQAGSSQYTAATAVSQVLTVSKASQTIAFASIPTKSFIDTDFYVSAVSSANLPVSYSITDTTVARFINGKVHIIKAGATGVIASQAGSANYNAASPVTRTFTVGKAAQTITFSALPTKQYGDIDFTLSAVSSSGLPVSFVVKDTTVAKLVNGTVKILRAGTTGIVASQAGNSNYNAAPGITQTLTINRASQSITFANPTAKKYGDAAFALGATATSGLVVSYLSSDTLTAKINVTGVVTLRKPGTVTITASQAGSTNYNVAASVSRTLSIGKGDQAITFAALPSKTFGDASFAPGAVSSSKLVVDYSSSDTSVAVITAGRVVIKNGGQVTITAIQSGSDLYNAAPSVSQQLSIGKAAQTITFAAITAKLFGGADFALTAVSTSKLPISFTSSNTAVATVTNGLVHITGVGTATITASQDGNSKYTAAAAVSQVLTVNKASQTITFATIPTKTYIDTDFYVSAVSSANLPVSYSITDTTVARFINGKVHIIKAGTVGIIASQAGNGSYNAANPVTRNVTIGKAAQTITFATLTAKKYSDGSFTLSATSSSGLAVSYLSSDTLTAKINAAGVVTLRKQGTVTITASQAGNANYNAAASLNRTLSIIKGDQAITFAALPAKTFGDASFAPGAVSSSKLVVDYSSSDTTVAAITAGKVVIKNSGQATITAKQTGNDLYNAAPAVSQQLSIGKAAQTITFAAITAKLFGGADFALTAVSSSKLPVSFTSSNTAVATVANGVVHITGAGTATITASQAGNSQYTAATAVSQVLTVSKASQTITFASIPTKSFIDTDFYVSAVSSAGLPVSYSITDTTVARFINGKVHIIKAGATGVIASQAGSANYNAASPVTRTFTVGKAAQTITFSALPTKQYGDSDFTLSAVSSSGLPVSFVVKDTTMAKLVNGTVKILRAGTTGIVASQAGNSNYNAAPGITQTLTINKASQSITFANPPAKKYGDAAFALGATSSSGLAVSYLSSDTLTAKINVTGVVTLRKPGTVTITASQAGSTNYNVAASVSRTLSIGKGDQAITFAALPSKTFGDASFAPGAVSSSKLVVDYSSSDTSVAVITAGRVVIKNGGQVTITAIQSGSDLYNAAPSVSQQLSIGKAAQTITFAAITAKLFGGADFALTAVSTSKLPISFSSSNTAVATVTNGVVHITGAGTATITANQAGSSQYTAATAVRQVLTVNKASQTITFVAITGAKYGSTDVQLNATASSKLAVTSYTSSNTAVATIVNGRLHIIGAGSVVITANQAGDNNYNAANAVNTTVSIAKAPLTIMAENKTKVSGAVTPVLTAIYSGFVNGDTTTVFLTPLVIKTTTATAAGTYPITLSGVTATNYAITLVNGTLTITPKPATGVSQPVLQTFAANTSTNTADVKASPVVRSALSPNGDGMNDVLIVDALEAYPDNTLTIMNMSGTKVYEAKSYDNVNRVFDGRSNITGAVQKPGTYFYLLEYKDSGETKKKTGYVIIKY